MENKIIDAAINFGASAGGVVAAAELRNAPSYKAHGRFNLPEWVASLLVIGLEHPESHPELDDWGGRAGTRGNRMLKAIADNVGDWAAKEFDAQVMPLKYHMGKKGTFLKDAAALAGMGVIGKNNLLITPRYGPRIRLRALGLGRRLDSTALTDFSPCEDCDAPCRTACPVNAFSKSVYSRRACAKQMRADKKRDAVEKSKTGNDYYLRYCRACETACPTGGK